MDQDLDKIARSEAARIMGRAKSERKAAAVRINGKLGGRPKKLKETNQTISETCTCAEPKETSCNIS